MTTCIIAHSTVPSTRISRELALTIGASPSTLTSVRYKCMQMLTCIQVLFNATTTTTMYAILDLLLLNADTDVSTSSSMLPSSLPLEKKRVVGHVSGEGLAPTVSAYSRMTDPRRWYGTVSYYICSHTKLIV